MIGLRGFDMQLAVSISMRFFPVWLRLRGNPTVWTGAESIAMATGVPRRTNNSEAST
jgi:hypothetical protein